MKKNNSIKILSKQKIYRKLISDASISGGIWRLHEIIALSDLILQKPVLDLGCGNGSFIKMITDGKLDFGLDLSLTELNQARKNRAYKKYIVADAHHIPLPNQSIQTVFSNSVFEHIPELEKVLSEISRVLKPGGRLIFTTHTPTSRFFYGTKVLKKLGFRKAAQKYENLFSNMLQLKTLWSLTNWKRRLSSVDIKIEEYQIIISPSASFWFEFFLPFTFIQNRIRFLRKLFLMPLISSLLNIDYQHTSKYNRNFFILARKKI